MSVSTRPALPADITAITAIYADAVANGTASFEIVPPDEAEMGRRMKALTDRNYPFVVAEDGEGPDRRLLGFAYAGPYRERPAYRNTVEDSVYLAPESRGQGIGGVLLRLLIDASTARGYRQMIAVIGDSKNAPSIRLHRAAGFEPVGTLKSVGFKHGRWLDVVIMQLALGTGDSTLPEQ
jgi:L-amino acid N-acyltransferase YncA